MGERPTWALIDEAVQAAGIVEGFANTIAGRRRGTSDERLALHVADRAKRLQGSLRTLDREDPDDA